MDHPVFEAVLQGDVEALARVLSEDPKAVEEQQFDKQRPLHYAAYSGRLDLVDLLLAHKAKVDAKDNDGATPLHVAARNGHREVALRLRGAGANTTKYPKRDLPLHEAARAGNVEAVELCLELGMDADHAHKSYGVYRTPLMELVSSGHIGTYPPRGAQIVQLLAQHGANVDFQNNRGETPLHLAAQENRPDLVQALLDAGAGLEIPEEDGATPLFFVLLKGHLATLRLLLERGADARTQRKDGSTPLKDASERLGLRYAARVLQEHLGENGELTFSEEIRPAELFCACQHGDLEDVCLILDDDPSLVESRYLFGVIENNTPLHVAASMGQTEVARLLLDRGHDPNPKKRFGLTPLHDACDRGHTEIARLLIQHGAELDARSSASGACPVHEAAEGAFIDTMRVLVEAGADLSRTNDKGLTPLAIARNKPYAFLASAEQYEALEAYLVSVGAPEA